MPDPRPTQTWIAPLLADFPESARKERVVQLARTMDAHLAKPTPRVDTLADAHRAEGNRLWWRIKEEFEALEAHHTSYIRRQRVMLAAAAVVVMMTVGSLAAAGLV
ncbi:MAG: hypothetical protein Rubg2KO_20630 [Rubricoccaceae bacterium]